MTASLPKAIRKAGAQLLHQVEREGFPSRPIAMQKADMGIQPHTFQRRRAIVSQQAVPVFNFFLKNNKSEPMINRQKVRIILFWQRTVILIETVQGGATSVQRGVQFSI